jgi:two-component system sensor histidine kinase RpfC
MSATAPKLMSTLRALLARAHTRRSDELGREQGQAMVRVVVVVCALLFLIAGVATREFGPNGPLWIGLLVSYLGLSCVVLVLTRRDNAASLARRATMNAADAAAISYLMIATGELGIPFFVLYLWVTLGNGLRFGQGAMLVSMALNLAGFSVVVATTPVWQAKLSFATAVWLALLLLPLYAAHLIGVLKKAQVSIANAEFLARVSRELQAPLKNIAGTADLLVGSRRLAPNERSLLEVIRDSVHLALRQVENVLDVSRLGSGTLLLAPSACDLHETVNVAADMVRPTAVRRGVRLLVRIDPATPYRLLCAERHLRDMLLHLMSDAVQHSAQGLVSVDVHGRDDTDRRVTLCVEVRDVRSDLGTTGRAAHANRLGAADKRGDATRDGLGIAIARQLAQLMGGHIDVDARDGRGLRLDIAVTKDASGIDADPKLPGIRAMLVSHESHTIEHFQDALQRLDGQLFETPSDQEAVDLLTRAFRIGNPVHALMIDAALALTADGAHRFGALCAKAQAADVPIFLVSDIVPPAARLRELGYSAVLARRAALSTAFAALRAAPLWRGERNRGIVTLAPWLGSHREVRRPRILVADDNRTNLMIVRRMLEHAGYDVDDAASGTEALERLSAGHYRVAILDIHMPDMSGISVLRQYRLRRPRSRLATIILTANASLDAQQQSADAGADAYLAKPVTTADLLNEVERLLRAAQVELLPTPPRVEEGGGVYSDPVLQANVLADLDRLYQHPRGLSQLIGGYEQEGNALLERIHQACRESDPTAFGDWIRALKSNAANMGAIKLMRICGELEALSHADFRRDPLALALRLQEAFGESVAALHGLVLDLPSSVNKTD